MVKTFLVSNYSFQFSAHFTLEEKQLCVTRKLKIFQGNHSDQIKQIGKIFNSISISLK